MKTDGGELGMTELERGVVERLIGRKWSIALITLALLACSPEWGLELDRWAIVEIAAVGIAFFGIQGAVDLRRSNTAATRRRAAGSKWAEKYKGRA